MEDYITKNVELKLDKDLNALSVKFLGFISYEDFMTLIEYEYAFIEHHQLTKAIIDLRGIPVYAEGMPEYIKEQWFPKVSSLGIKYVAIIVPDSSLGKMSMKKAHENTTTIAGMSVVNFGDTESAEPWLKSF